MLQQYAYDTVLLMNPVIFFFLKSLKNQNYLKLIADQIYNADKSMLFRCCLQIPWKLDDSAKGYKKVETVLQ